MNSNNQSNTKSIYIVDTNVIIANPYFYRDLSAGEILIPIYVLEELDKLKTRDGNTGFRARQFFRILKNIEEKGDLNFGIELEKDKIIKIIIETNLSSLPENLDSTYVDNKILSLLLLKKYSQAVLVTNDVSMRIKASALGIKNYLLDASNKHKLDDLYSGVITLSVEVDLVKEFYRDGEIDPIKLGIEEINPNEFVYGYTGFSYSKIEGRYDLKSKKIVKLKYAKSTLYGITALDVEQKFLIEALLSPNIPFVTITGRQGCGKTLVAFAAGLELVLQGKKYTNVTIGKNTSPIDKWSYQGFTTGDTEEKLVTHFGNFTTTLENIQNARGKGKKNGVEMLLNLKLQEKLDILDISSILGSSFIDRFIIIDEAQSFDAHAMRSIITRIGKGCKLVVIGDIGQQTMSRLDPDKSGLYTAVEWLKGLEETAHITLKSVHRSSFIEKAGKILMKNYLDNF